MSAFVYLNSAAFCFVSALLIGLPVTGRWGRLRRDVVVVVSVAMAIAPYVIRYAARPMSAP